MPLSLGNSLVDPLFDLTGRFPGHHSKQRNRRDQKNYARAKTGQLRTIASQELAHYSRHACTTLRPHVLLIYMLYSPQQMSMRTCFQSVPPCQTSGRQLESGTSKSVKAWLSSGPVSVTQWNNLHHLSGCRETAWKPWAEPGNNGSVQQSPSKKCTKTNSIICQSCGVTEHATNATASLSVPGSPHTPMDMAKQRWDTTIGEKKGKNHLSS